MLTPQAGPDPVKEPSTYAANYQAELEMRGADLREVVARCLRLEGMSFFVGILNPHFYDLKNADGKLVVDEDAGESAVLQGAHKTRFLVQPHNARAGIPAVVAFEHEDHPDRLTKVGTTLCGVRERHEGKAGLCPRACLQWLCHHRALLTGGRAAGWLAGSWGSSPGGAVLGAGPGGAVLGAGPGSRSWEAGPRSGSCEPW